MNKKIDFKQVAETVRFDLLGSIEMPTPCDFAILSAEEKISLYKRIFDLYHDVCCYLSSSLDIDELISKYSEENQNGAGE